MAILGLRDTGNFVANQRPENWREGLLILDPNGMTTLTGLTSLMNKRVVDDPRFHWWEKETQTRRFQLHATLGDLSTTNTTIVLVATALAKGLKEGDVLRVEQTDELIQVSADPSSQTQFEATRGFAGSTPATVDPDAAGINPNLTVIGNAYEEGSLAPTGVAFDPTEKDNRTQIFRDTLEATRTAQKTRLRTGDAVKEAKRECLLTHGQGIERALWQGRKSLTTKNGKPVHTMDGVERYIAAANVKVVTTDHAAGLDMEGLEEYMYEAFLFGSSEKMGFCGNRALLTIGQVLRKNASWHFQSGIKEFGMNVTRITSPFGEIVLKTHPGFNQLRGGVTAGTAYHGTESWLYILDMAELTYVHLKDSDTMWQPDLQDNGLDGMKAGYLTECAIEVHHPKSHFLLKNLVKAAVDA